MISDSFLFVRTTADTTLAQRAGVRLRVEQRQIACRLRCDDVLEHPLLGFFGLISHEELRVLELRRPLGAR